MVYHATVALTIDPNENEADVFLPADIAALTAAQLRDGRALTIELSTDVDDTKWRFEIPAMVEFDHRGEIELTADDATQALQSAVSQKLDAIDRQTK